MTTTNTDISTSLYGPQGEYTDYIRHEKGIWSWMTTLDHKRIALMYMCGVLGSLFLGGIFAMLVRTEHLTGGATITSSGDVYNQWFTLHGAVMVFLFIIPGIPAILGNFALPILLGAKDVAFPRLNLASFYLWCFGAVFFVITLVTSGLDTGWTFYTPYSVGIDPATGEYHSHTAVAWATFGVFILGFSSILTGLNFIATTHMLRAPGMTWFRVPLFVWALYATAIIQILATPVLAITLLLLLAERLLHVGIFDPALGGDPVLYQHFFWFYSHPAVYIMALPAFGVISELVATYSHKHIFGYKFIALSSIAIAFLGFLVWGHHLFVSGQSAVAGAIFSIISFTIAIPTAIKVFNWLATMFQGSIELRTPMLYAMSFLWVFSIGGLTGMHLATIGLNVHLHDTYFVVAHFHYVMVGGTLFALLGGLHHWWPKIFGKMYSERWGRVAWFLIFVGFNLTFFVQFYMGSNGMPRRYWSYDEQYWLGQFLSTMGAYTQLAGFLVLTGVFLHSLTAGRRAAVNPWGGTTLEWQTTSPPPHTNFAETPIAGDPYDYESLEYDSESGNYRRRVQYHGPGAGEIDEGGTQAEEHQRRE